MKSLPLLLGGLLLLSTVTGASAVEPASTTKPGKALPLPEKPDAATAEKPKLNPIDYIDVLTASLALSDPERKEIVDLYEIDGAAIQKIGNDAALSPLQKSQQISDLRNERNSKIEDILHDIDRKKTFHDVEVVYRVDVTEIALDGGLLPPASPAPAPAAPAPAAKPAPAPAAAPAKATPPPM